MNVNIGQLARILASERVVEQHKRNFTISHGFEPSKKQLNDILYEEDKEGDIGFKDSAKQVFNDYYAMFEDMIKSSENIDGILVKKDKIYDNYDYLKHQNLKKVFIDEVLVKLESILTPLVKTDIVKEGKRFSIDFILKKRK